MNKLLKIAMAGALLLGITATVASASPDRGQRIYQKDLNGPCNATGAKVAAAHSQDEWKDIKESGKLGEAMNKICPNLPATFFEGKNERYIDSLFDFFIHYANDSGNVPSC
ncbi:cytochrome C [Arcobacter sp. FWKO B]|uniref:cytochrome C n=1 Tax=Arcobacter sp. FWKO B TaxID=2593672 RepID=UPI0018A5E44D|nr:cytochrome C [Arcobacter sp. FWKO B]QOG12133.1 cytochrome C [Arcobacter sp. FWKO B]